jgi:TolB-like protein
VVLAGLTALLLPRATKQSQTGGASATIAVLPFLPASADTTLERLGRDLSTTVSATLDGVGDLSTVDRLTILAHWPQDRPASSLEENAAKGRQLGAASVLHGSIVRTGELVRLDLSLESSDSLARLAQVTVTGQPEDINALTDSITWQLLRQIWRGESAPTPSLDGALRTRSVTALRAFLAGERNVSGGAWDAAVRSYSEAFQADSGFYLAASRLLLAQYWSLQGEDTAVEAVVREHVDDMPARERLLMQAFLQQHASVSATLASAGEQVRRYPDYWFGWLFYGDWLFHFGPTLGRPLAEAGVAFERALELAPDLIPAWDHLGALTARQRNLDGLRRVLHNLDRLDAGPMLAADGFGDHLLLLRLAERELAGDRDALEQLVERAARDDLLQRQYTNGYFDPMLLNNFTTQVRLYRTAARIDRSGPQRPALPAAVSWLEDWRTFWLSKAWLGWRLGPALVALDRSTAAGRMEAYRTAVMGAVVEAVDTLLPLPWFMVAGTDHRSQRAGSASGWPISWRGAARPAHPCQHHCSAFSAERDRRTGTAPVAGGALPAASWPRRGCSI